MRWGKAAQSEPLSVAFPCQVNKGKAEKEATWLTLRLSPKVTFVPIPMRLGVAGSLRDQLGRETLTPPGNAKG